MIEEEIEKQAEEYIRENVCNKERVFGSQSVCSDKAIGECNECENFCYFATINRKSYLAGAKWGYDKALKELVERVEKDQSERQVQTINVIELKATIKDLGVDL